MATSKLQIIVETNTRQLDKLQAKVKQSQGNLSKLQGKGKQVSQSFNQIGVSANKAANGISKTGRAAQQASGGFNSLGKSLRSLLAAYSLFEAVKFTIGSTAELETQRKSLEVLTGSVKEANTVIKQLQDFGAVTPFTSTELIDTAKRLKAFGVDTDKLVDTTKRLGDVAGATGAKLEGVATAYGQIQAKGRLQGEELLQLQERGINLQDELQKMYGLTGEEFRKALEKGRISAEAVELALQNLTDTGGKYADGAIAQSETLAGKFSTLVDGLTRIAQTIGSVVSPAIKAILGEAINAINTINKLIGIAQKANKFGLDVRAQKGILDQARAEAEEIVNLRNIADPFKRNAEFQRIAQERESDLLDKYGYENGILQVEIEPVLANGAQTIPELLGGTSPSGGGRSGSSGGRAAGSSRIDDTAEKQAKAYESIRQSLERTILLESELTREGKKNTDLQKDKLKNAFEYEATVKRIRSEVNAAQQEELIGLAQLKQEQANYNALKESASDFAGYFAEAAETDKQLNEELIKTDELLKSSFDIVANGLQSGIQGLIDGTKEWGDILSDVASQLGSLFLNAAFSSLSSGLNIPGFAEGGRPEPGKVSLVGERGPELFVPDGPGTVIPNEAFDAARGAMGGAATPSEAFADNTSSISTTNSYIRERAFESNNQTTVGSGGSMVIETQVINNVEYASVEQLRVASAAAAKQARAQVFSDMKNKPSRRAMVGMK